MSVTLNEIVALSKRVALVIPSGEIYGSIAGFWDYGPSGTEIKNNIKREWWRYFVHERDDIIGMDGAIITHPRVWAASGHTKSFNDPLFSCKKCKTQVRGDSLIEEKTGIAADGIPSSRLTELMREHDIRCSKCKGELQEARKFNLMFRTTIGTDEEAYLRGETAQLIFTNFKQIMKATRKKLPFGIAQIGRAFRNEISPRNFLFRSREFEQMEIEFFTHPEEKDKTILRRDQEKLKVNILTAKAQEKGRQQESMTIAEAMKKRLFASSCHAYWLAEQYLWYLEYGIYPDKLRLREHLKNELAHYASACYDIEYNFPFGWKEIYGNADRGTFDLRQHAKYSKKDLSVFDEKSNKKIMPAVAAEPSVGVDRAFLAFICGAYTKKGKRLFLRLDPRLAPAICLVAPLMAKDGLDDKAREIYGLLKSDFVAVYDESGSIGKRYARADEIGIPFAVTVDYETLKDNTVTIRNRDTTDQKRIGITKIRHALHMLFSKKKKFEDL